MGKFLNNLADRHLLFYFGLLEVGADIAKVTKVSLSFLTGDNLQVMSPRRTDLFYK
jgi:hypothetical protein